MIFLVLSANGGKPPSRMSATTVSCRRWTCSVALATRRIKVTGVSYFDLRRIGASPFGVVSPGVLVRHNPIDGFDRVGVDRIAPSKCVLVGD